MTALLTAALLLQTFDAASIKPSIRGRKGGEGSSFQRLDRSPTTLTLENTSLSLCIQYAYNVRFYQVEGPDWLNSERFDIIAKSAAPASSDEHRRMMRALLADRFKLALHRGSKEMNVYALTESKSGARLAPAKPGTPNSLHVADGGFVFGNTNMQEFAERLSGFRTIDRPVVDATGLSGSYDFTFRSAAAAMLQADGPSIQSLIGDLGLKLEPRKQAVEILYIDHAEKVPTEN